MTTATITRHIAPCHLDDLRKSGLSDATIEAAGIYTEYDPVRLAQIIKWKKWRKSAGQGLVFRYRDWNGELNGYAAIKPQNPGAIPDRAGKPRKYLLPRNEPNRIYIPANTLPALKDPARELLITEGQKKALKADQEGFPCIALAGVWGWKDGKKADRLIHELLQMDWKGKPVFIVYDSDLKDNEQVADAESRLAAQLAALGAVVKVVRLPSGPNGDKVGLDDFLVAQGKDALWKLIAEAQAPEPIDGEAERVHAETLDAMIEGRRYLREKAFHPDGHTLVSQRGVFHAYDGRKYREICDDEIRATVWTHLDPSTFQIKRPVVGNIMEAIRALTMVPANRERPCWLDRPTGNGKPETKYIAMQNGILDIEALLTGSGQAVLPHSPKWYSTVCLPYPFDPAATCPKWLNVVERNLEGDPQRIAVLQEWFGYCMVPDTSLQRLIAYTGDGGNGKSVACAVQTAVLGVDNVSSVSLENFAMRFQLHSTLGKLANIIPEVGEIDRVAEGMIKAFTSGDRMQFERKQKDPFEAMPTARLVLATNNLPRFTDRSSGMWRRIIIMPFRVSIPAEEKVHGMDKPEWWEQSGELPGIFNWSIKGLQRLREQGDFTDSDICRRELAEHRLDSNPARQFLESRCMVDPEGDIATQELYSEYSNWCVENGHYKLASNTFGKEIVRAFPRAIPGKVWVNDRRVPGYFGVKRIVEVPDSF